jgi:hypothetical protein
MDTSVGATLEPGRTFCTPSTMIGRRLEPGIDDPQVAHTLARSTERISTVSSLFTTATL